MSNAIQSVPGNPGEACFDALRNTCRPASELISRLMES
jgi:hypothetical protein